MADQWFRLPETGTGTPTDPIRPNLFGHEVDGWSGNKTYRDGSPVFVVRVYADQQTLDSLAAEPQTVELGSVPETALNQMFDQDRDAEGWRNGFNIQ